LLGTVLERGVSQVECWLSDGIQKAMSLFNGRIAPSAEQRKSE
jgi:hypothetical protein